MESTRIHHFSNTYPPTRKHKVRHQAQAKPHPSPPFSGAGKSGKRILWLAALCFCLPVVGPIAALLGSYILGIILLILGIVTLCQGATRQGLFVIFGSLVLLPICFCVGVYTTLLVTHHPPKNIKWQVPGLTAYAKTNSPPEHETFPSTRIAEKAKAATKPNFKATKLSQARNSVVSQRRE